MLPRIKHGAFLFIEFKKRHHFGYGGHYLIAHKIFCMDKQIPIETLLKVGNSSEGAFNHRNHCQYSSLNHIYI